MNQYLKEVRAIDDSNILCYQDYSESDIEVGKPFLLYDYSLHELQLKLRAFLFEINGECKNVICTDKYLKAKSLSVSDWWDSAKDILLSQDTEYKQLSGEE